MLCFMDAPIVGWLKVLSSTPYLASYSLRGTLPISTIQLTKIGKHRTTRRSFMVVLIIWASVRTSKASLAYSVAKLGVEHVLVMGHYGCGGVAAAIAPAPTEGADEDTLAIQQWISPIHQLFQSSNRSEIVRLREQTRLQPQSVQPDIHDGKQLFLISSTL